MTETHENSGSHPGDARVRAAAPASDRALTVWFAGDYIRPHAAALFLAFILMAIDGAILGGVSLLLTPMFDRVLVAVDRTAGVLVAFAIGGLFVLRALVAPVHKTIIARVAERVTATLQQRLAADLMRLDLTFHHRHPPGALIARVLGDTAEVQHVFTALLPGFGREGIRVVVLIAVAAWTDPLWTLVTLVGAPLLILPMVVLRRLIRKLSVSARTAAAEASTRLDEIFHGVATIQRNGLEAREEARLQGALKGFVRARTRTAAAQALLGSATDLVTAVGVVLVLILASAQIAAGDRTIGQFMTFFAAIGFMFEPVRRLAGLAGVWQQVLASLGRIRALLDTEPAVRPPAPPTLALPRDLTICFDQVVFRYEGPPVLRGLSFKALPHQSTAIVGPSGAGKSTVFTLLCRLADPEAGRITIGGHDIARLDLAALRGLFATVTQDTALFDESLRDNITLGRAVPEARLKAALAAAHIDEFLPSLPQGLETRVGPRGSALSGGQRQRVAIARALVRDAPIVLLDEPTSALDAASEALVQDALQRLLAGRTTLVIAHRLATVRQADTIVVMDRGQVVEDGPHEALIAAGGLYARLYALQMLGRHEG